MGLILDISKAGYENTNVELEAESFSPIRILLQISGEYILI